MQDFQLLFSTIMGWLYYTISNFYKYLFLSKGKQFKKGSIPLVVIGSTRAGGGARTHTTMALANELTLQGLRVKIMCLDFLNVKSLVWDDAILHQKKFAVVYTRDRYKSWIAEKECDVIISDGGLEDPRLNNAIKIELQREPSEFFHQLWPMGSHRSFSRDHYAIIWKSLRDYTLHYQISKKESTPKTLVCAQGDPIGFGELLQSESIQKLVIVKNHTGNITLAIKKIWKKNPYEKVLIGEKESTRIGALAMDPRIYIVTLSVEIKKESLLCVTSYF